ncbi:protein kinase C and casein kinase substrate in neurons protein 2-like [Rhopilema esculentum]|uniref:protein kinase C and casein kinase substrate in neurons protein 2-like n=1 Tax=Rhopilema esculentum TaxID=499914 RepID=UPI0031D93559
MGDTVQEISIIQTQTDVNQNQTKTDVERITNDGPNQSSQPNEQGGLSPGNTSDEVQSTCESGVDKDENAHEQVNPLAEGPRNSPPPDYVQEATSASPPLPPDTDLSSSENSFWLTGNYKKIVRKVDDGAKFCEELGQMMLERAEIESLYAKKLKAWKKKWLQSFSKGLEYGSVLQSVVNGLQESEEMADIHLAIQGKVFEVSQQIQVWKAESYHKGIIGLKETKKVDEGFIKAQKPWAKKYEDVIKGKNSYHLACQTLDTLKAQQEEIKANKESSTQDQVMKIENKVKKAVQDRENVLETYKEALRDIGNYNQKYREDMVYEYDKFETLESKRKEFVIGKVKDYRECVDVSNFQSRIEKIYSNMADSFNSADASSDSEWYRRTFGPDMPFITLSFVEYDPEAREKEKLQNPEASPASGPKKSSKVCVAL